MPRAVRQGQGAGDNARLVQRRHMGPNIFLYTRLRLSPNAAVLISVVTSSVVIVVVAAAAVVHKASFDPTSTPPFPNQQFLAHDSSVHPPPCLRHPSISNPHCTRSGCAQVRDFVVVHVMRRHGDGASRTWLTVVQSAPAVTPAADLVDAMANTFADYPAHTMANNDFTLYPYQDQTWDNDSFLPNSNFSDPNFVNPTTLDSFPANAAYANEHFTFQSQTYRQQSPSHPKHAVQATSSTYSPTLSASHSFDAQNPPLLSSTSDSGASVQSTISSAMGSPSGFAQTSTGVEWSLPDMRLLPGIVQQDCMNTAAPELFATSAFDLETVPVTDKGCVGELFAVSSSSSSSHQPAPAPPSHLAPFHDAHVMDSEGLGDHGHGFIPSAHQPFSMPAHEQHTWPTVVTPKLSPNDSLFKSPTTPASATSPVIERVKGDPASSIALPSRKRARGSSPLAKVVSYGESDLPVRPRPPPPMFSSPFFQCSGHFVLPLESSCPSPLFILSCFFFDQSSAEDRRNMWLTIHVQIRH